MRSLRVRCVSALPPRPAARRVARAAAARRPYSAPTMLKKSLSLAQDTVLASEVSALVRLRDTLAKAEASKEDVGLVQEALGQLEQLFSLVVVGEFNAGKSSFINALLGRKFLKDGVTPTTSNITLLRYGESVSQSVSPQTGFDLMTLPVEWLRDITVVDTPGTNAVLKDHQHITEHFVPRADLVLFVTSTDRAYSESERAFLKLIKQFNKKIVSVVTKIDLLETDEDLAAILDFVRRNSQELLGPNAPLFPVSSRQALAAKTRTKGALEALAKDELWAKSRFGPLEEYLLKTLDPQRRARLKMENPLGVAEHIVGKYAAEATARLGTLRGDLDTLKAVEEQRTYFRTDLDTEFKNHSHRIDNVLMRLTERAQAFLDNKIALSNIWELATSNRLTKDFESDVVGASLADIEHMITDLVDWLAAKEKRYLSSVALLVKTQTPALAAMRTDAAPLADFDERRRRLLDGIGRAAKQVIDGYDKSAESARLSQEVSRALLSTAALEVSAVGLGSVVSALLFDLSGVFVGGALAVAGLAVLPYKKAQLQRTMRERITLVRKDLAAALSRHFDSEAQSLEQRVADVVGPYSGFVKSEQQRLTAIATDLSEQRTRIAALRRELAMHFKDAAV